MRSPLAHRYRPRQPFGAGRLWLDRPHTEPDREEDPFTCYRNAAIGSVILWTVIGLLVLLGVHLCARLLP